VPDNVRDPRVRLHPERHSRTPSAAAEVTVLTIQEKPLIEAAEKLERSASNEQSGSAESLRPEKH
jgi:hypothetical protein